MRAKGRVTPITKTVFRSVRDPDSSLLEHTGTVWGRAQRPRPRPDRRAVAIDAIRMRASVCASRTRQHHPCETEPPFAREAQHSLRRAATCPAERRPFAPPTQRCRAHAGHGFSRAAPAFFRRAGFASSASPRLRPLRIRGLEQPAAHAPPPVRIYELARPPPVPHLPQHRQHPGAHHVRLGADESRATAACRRHGTSAVVSTTAATRAMTRRGSVGAARVNA